MSAALLAFLPLHFLAGVFLKKLLPVAPPVFMVVRAAGAWLDRRLNRENRRKKDLAARGLVITAIFAALALFVGAKMPPSGDTPLSILPGVALLFLCAGTMRPLSVLRDAAAALKEKKTEQAANILRPHIRMPKDESDPLALARQAVEWSAQTLNTWLTGPLLFGLFFGAKGVLLYTVIAALRVSTAADDVAHAYFGLIPRWFDDALNFFAGAVTSALIALSCVFVAGAHPWQALKTVLSRSRNYPRGTGEWPVAAMAGALHVTLAGPPWDWLGPEGSSAKVTPEDLQRCALLHFVFFLCVMALVSGGILLAHFPQFLK